jgi:serine protease Do
MNKSQFFLGILLASVIGAVIALAGAGYFMQQEPSTKNFSENRNTSLVNWLSDEKFHVPDGINFVASAEMVTPAVVHVRSTVSVGQGRSRGFDPFEEFFGFKSPEPREGPSREARSSGSGAIISPDGYIVTNNHVIDNASRVEVTLEDNRRFTAKVIGTDPTTDLALLKIEGKDLPYVSFGDSDAAKVGEWVLAVGNPMDLTSTVTAGIISAKARNIRILRDENNLQVEAFIQTDAAVNPGNSGGPLVNLAGEIIGINTAIASRTGGFSGYSFAIPSSIARKVMDDLLEFGTVQRGLLGVQINDVSPELAEYLDTEIKETRGVYVIDVNEGSGGAEAGLKSGDVIIGVDGTTTYTTSKLQEMVARKRPGDKVEITYIRDGKEKTTTATLKNFSGDTEVVKRAVPKTAEFEGVSFEDVRPNIKDRLRIEGGAAIVSLDNEKWKKAGVKEGFVITQVGRTKIKDAEHLEEVLRKNKGEEVIILGVYSSGQQAYFEVKLD